MSLGDHLEELRSRIIWALVGLAIGMTLCMVFGGWIVSLIEYPYEQAMKQAKLAPSLQTITPADGFISYMTITMIAGAIVASPWIFYQIWKFVGAGLYPRERRYVYKVLPFSIALFLAGAALFFFFLGPLTIAWLVWFNDKYLHTQSNFTFTGLVSFVANMTLVCGITFQTPIVVFFLFKIHVVTVAQLKQWRKYVVLAVAILVAVAAPMDMFSYTLLCIVMYALYEAAIWLCWLSDRKKRETVAANAIDTCDKKSD